MRTRYLGNKRRRIDAKLLEGSRLAWTIVYATLLKNKSEVGYHLVVPDEAVTANNSVNRVDVAECLLDAPGDRTAIRQSLLITGSPKATTCHTARPSNGVT